MTTISTKKRLLILICGLTETLVFSGILIGWPALFYMLKAEGIYQHLCISRAPISPLLNHSMYDPAHNEIQTDQEINAKPSAIPEYPVLNKISDNNIVPELDCTAQENILNLTYTFGIFSMGLTSFVWGFLMETWGLRKVRLLLTFLTTCGCTLLCLTSAERSYLIVPAIILIGLGGLPYRVVNMEIADYFPAHRSTIISFISGAFSASPVVFVLLKYMYDYGITFLTVQLVLVFCSLLSLPFTYLLLPVISVKNQLKIKSRIDLRINDLSVKNDLDLLSAAKSDGPEHSLINGHVLSEKRSEASLSVSFWSMTFTIHQLWYSWINTYIIYYSGSMNLWLNRVTDNPAQISGFTKMFGLVQITALIIAPIAGIFMDSHTRRANKESDPFRRRLQRAQSGFWPIMITTVVLAICSGLRLSNTTGALYVSIVFITLLRFFLVAVASAYVRIRFPAHHFNRLNAIMPTTAALFCLVQFPLFVWESQSNYYAFLANMFCLVISIICFVNPIHLMVTPLQKHLLRKEESPETRE